MTAPESLLDTKGKTAQERWSEENIQDVVQLWNLSDTQEAKFRELGTRLEDIESWKNCPYEVIRYFSEFKGDLKKVEKMFRAMISWRAKNDIDSVLSTHGEPHPLFHYMPIALLEGADKEGDAIYLDRMGAADSWGLLTHFGMEEMVQHFIFLNEYINDRDTWKWFEAKQGHHHVRNFNVVIDLHGLNAGHMRPGLLPLLNKVASITQPYYAGWAKRIFLIRVPRIFKFIWSLSKHFFEPHIRDMIVIASHSDYLELLEQHIDLENLPDCVAPGIGKGKGMPGYFEQVHLEGGPIPDSDELEAKKMNDILHSKQLDRQETTMSMTSVSTVASDVSVSGKLMLKGHWDYHQHHKGSIVTAFSASSNSLSSLDE